ncbi:hypothetical protein BDV26DRAFT_284215 [Aspergillus bertholletiae]|uniref:Integrase zinc-binding domain-containing protein n=1 Tax=Aspergillus bertholletiae TaxID=1226010 RepID=A0A5N7AXT6_9EURO|nr:hypothetical protein BDV26DRAFT_284215 [Aspergillus bertholletiae]
MTSAIFPGSVTFCASTKLSFLQYIRENPSNRRVSASERESLIEWLTNPDKRPSSQQEFSRRHYVRKAFCWDSETQTLTAISKTGEGNNRAVVEEDAIADIVELVHEYNGHAGWDATWKDVSTFYYGILRSDVIFLLKKCQICAQNPSKQPKGPAIAQPNLQTGSGEDLDPDGLEYE